MRLKHDPDKCKKFPQNRSVISRHLEFLNRFKIVQRRKEGREVYYKANNMKALMNLL